VRTWRSGMPFSELDDLEISRQQEDDANVPVFVQCLIRRETGKLPRAKTNSAVTSFTRGWNGPRSKDLFAAALCEIIPSIDYALAADAA